MTVGALQRNTILRQRLTTALADRYRVERELGAGGMATVFLAHDLKHDRDVAIKVLHEELAETLGRERFEREIRLAARLTHPHILPLFDSGEAGGALFYVMPVMRGETLRTRLASGALPVADAVRIAEAIADALDYAHRHDVVHRDIKPENILLHEGHAVVADFGVGKAVVAASEAGTGAFTQVGMAVGTPTYMSPEQALGDTVDGRSDLFALGCVLYEMLTGTPPFTGANAQAVVASRFTQIPPAVSQLRPAIPEAVSRTVDHLLEKSPKSRLATGALVVQALRGQVPLSARREVPSVAVLPFTNMSGDPDNAYFSDGITDDIIVALTRLPALKVAARASAFTFRDLTIELQEVGRKLGVRHVLQGSVRRAGNRVRVTAQLMTAQDGTQQWSGRWDRELDDIFAIQDDIARGIVDELEVQLGTRPVAEPLVYRPTADVAAYELYLRGRESIRRRIPLAIRTGIAAFREALARDPGFALPWLGIAEAQAAMGTFTYRELSQCREDALEALTQAERLGVPAADLDRFRLLVTLYVGTDWRDAAPLVEQVLQLAPYDAFGNTMAAIFYGLLEDRERLAVAATRAMDGDPLSPWTLTVLGLAWSYVGEMEQALAMNDRAYALDPQFTTALNFRQSYLSALGRHEEAIACGRRLVELSDRVPIALAALARTLWQAECFTEARELAEEVRRIAPENAVVLLLMEHGMADEARLTSLLQMAKDQQVSAISLRGMWRLKQLLSHPRLGGLLRQLPGFSHLEVAGPR